MQRIGLLTLVGLIGLLLGGCARYLPSGHLIRKHITGEHMASKHMASKHMAGEHMAGEHMAGMEHRGMMHHTQMMTETTGISTTAAISPSHMAGPGHRAMDHSTMDHMMQADPATPFDAQFIDSMIDHHQGAVAMAEQVLAEAERAELRVLAEAIIAAQTAEIKEMTTWRQHWYPDLPPTGGMAMGMGDMAISTDTSKPFDQRFIEAMISHHQGAIEMAQMAQQMADHEEIKTLAAAIITAQQAEIEQMQSWLAEWFDISSASSPYATQLDSPVRGLSAQEVDELRAGMGMGFARMAELNNYPGPRHLLDLQQELTLSPEQVTAIDAIFTEMQTQAQALGAQILTQEAQLSAAFAGAEIAEEALQTQVMALADLYGQLRLVHLRAHLQVTPLLTPEQIQRYNELRGYAGDGEHAPMHQMHH